MPTFKLAIPALLALPLFACGGGDIDKVVELQTPAPEPGSDIETAHEGCTDNQYISDRYDEVEDDMVPAMYSGIMTELAEADEMPVAEYIGELARELAVYSADEQTLTMSSIFQQDDDGDLLPSGLVGGVISQCVLETLEVPTAVQDHIDTTRALDGQQEDSWDDYQARWTYHPDSGMNLTIWSDAS